MNKRVMIDHEASILSIQRQCELLGLARSSLYYEPIPTNSRRLAIMREIDEIYMEHPEYGRRRMMVVLRTRGHDVGHDLVRTLMKDMGIEAVYPRHRTSQPHPDHKVYPYLLRDKTVLAPNQVWSTDITYIPMRRGFLYLVAVIDWFSRYVLSWGLSNTLDSGFCQEALKKALATTKPEIFKLQEKFSAMTF